VELNSWRCGISVQLTLYEPDRRGLGPETLSVVGVYSGHGQSLFALEPCLAVLTVGHGGPREGSILGGILVDSMASGQKSATSN
jgi:hypothetical protein